MPPKPQPCSPSRSSPKRSSPFTPAYFAHSVPSTGNSHPYLLLQGDTSLTFQTQFCHLSTEVAPDSMAPDCTHHPPLRSTFFITLVTSFHICLPCWFVGSLKPAVMCSIATKLQIYNLTSFFKNLRDLKLQWRLVLYALQSQSFVKSGEGVLNLSFQRSLESLHQLIQQIYWAPTASLVVLKNIVR